MAEEKVIKRGRGRPKGSTTRTLKPAVAEAVVETLLPIIAIRDTAAPVITGPRAQSQIAQSGLEPVVCALVFAGLSQHEIGRKLRMSHDAVNNFVSSPDFDKIYNYHREMLLAKVNDLMAERMQEVLLEMIERKVEMARHARNESIRERAQSQLIEWGIQMAKGQKGGIGDALRMAYERKKTRKTEEGETITEKVTVYGDTDAETAARAADSVASGNADGPFAGSSEADRENGSAEAPRGARKAGSDAGNGESSPGRGLPPASETV